jgi:DNA repair protein RadA
MATKKYERIEDLPGVGDGAAKKLADAGFKTLEQIATASAVELKEIAGLGEGTADKVIKAARDSLDMGFETADVLAEKRKLVGRLTTGSKELDNLIGGGIETQSITEVYGKMASGKSQWCFQTAVTVQLPKEQGGLEGGCLYIDSENSFRPERVIQVAKKLGLDVDAALKNIHVARAYNAEHQMILADKAAEMVKEHNIKLVIIDSLTAQFRAEFVGRGTLAERQQKLNKHMRTLQKLAELSNVAVLVTNQVMSRPDILFGDPTEPVGGNVVGHASKTRLYLRKSKEDKRVAKLVDSPSLPDGEALYRITENGIEDVEE